MIHQMFFLVEARPELRAQVQDWADSELAELLLEPQLISQQHGCREITLRESFATRVKLLYLASIRDLEPLNEDAVAERLFGSARITVLVFERWWTVREIGNREDVEGMIDCLRPLVAKVDGTGDAWVDDWLARLRSTA